uniref:Uncharacterized protein n=1 Tax=Glossina pallidipes TaxID=7398 RepID=A0A1A9Z573_GLOPL
MCMFVVCMLCTEKRKGSTSSNGHTNRDAVSKTAFPVCVKKRTSSSSYSYPSATSSASTNCPSAFSSFASNGSFAAVTTNNYVAHTLGRVGTTTQTPSQLEDTAQIMSAERLSKAIYNDYPKSTSSTALCQDLSSYRVWL